MSALANYLLSVGRREINRGISMFLFGLLGFVVMVLFYPREPGVEYDFGPKKNRS